MIIEKLTIRNFRNYEYLNINFDKGIHLLTGNNGQGKTNLLESIYYLSCTKSHRTNENVDLIKENSTFFILEASILKNERKNQIKCIVNEKGKNLFFYKTPVKKVSDFIGTLNAVLFDPNDLFLFSSTPKNRRKFIDLELGKISHTYTNKLNTYYSLLKERNACLKEDKVDLNLLDILDERMIDIECLIIEQRQKFINDILSNSEYFYQELSEDNTKISCLYKSFVNYDSKDKMKEEIKLKYKKYRDKDIYYHVSNIGIHKDDYIFMMNDHEVNTYASQGQKRSIMLAVKLGIVKTIYNLTNTYPILLLDDVFSELDEKRRNKLLFLLDDDIENKQIFISTTDVIKINSKNITYWKIEKGNIVKEVY